MILIIDENRKRRETLSETFYYMGILSVSCNAASFLSQISPEVKAVLISEPCEIANCELLLSRLCAKFPNIPIFTVSNGDLPDGLSGRIAGIFKSGAYSSLLAAEIINYQIENGYAPLGKYILAGLDAGCDLNGVRYLSREVGLTKTEAMIVRYLIASYPTPKSAGEILLHAYKPTKKPEEAAVRTQISHINRKFSALRREKLITRCDCGYVLSPRGEK